MRHVAVRRAAVLVGGACLAWAAIFPFVVDDGRSTAQPPAAGQAAPSEAAALPPIVQPADGGDALYARHCASCHDAADMRASLGRGVDADRRAALEAFLAGHGGATADENRRILDFLDGVEPGDAAGR